MPAKTMRAIGATVVLVTIGVAAWIQAGDGEPETIAIEPATESSIDSVRARSLCYLVAARSVRVPGRPSLRSDYRQLLGLCRIAAHRLERLHPGPDQAGDLFPGCGADFSRE